MRVAGETSIAGENRMVGKLRRVVCMAAGHEKEEEGCRMRMKPSPECTSPAKVALCRLMSIVKKCRGGKVFVAMEEKEERELMKNRVSKRGKHVDDRRHSPEITPANDVSGHQKQEMTFNLAAGLGLLSLIAASKTELDKTMELRQEMEGFLRDIKEHQSNETTPKPSYNEHNNYDYTVSTTMDGLSNFSHYSFEEYHAPWLNHQPEVENSVVCDYQCKLYENEVSVEGLNHLEEELAAELELLQGEFDTGEVSESQEFNAKVSGIGDMATQSLSASSGEVIVDPQPEEEDAVAAAVYDDAEFSGVPPLELERRLHELLEARQEERIKELEFCVETMKKRLQEKEVEVTWWKDTAKLMSKHFPDHPSRILR